MSLNWYVLCGTNQCNEFFKSHSLLLQRIRTRIRIRLLFELLGHKKRFYILQIFSSIKFYHQYTIWSNLLEMPIIQIKLCVLCVLKNLFLESWYVRTRRRGEKKAEVICKSGTEREEGGEWRDREKGNKWAEHFLWGKFRFIRALESFCMEG